jgi:carboxyl-terminal processing protease
MVLAGCTGTSSQVPAKTPATPPAAAQLPLPDKTTVKVTPPTSDEDLQKLDGTKPTPLSDIPPFADTEDLRGLYKLIRQVHITSDATDKELYYGALKGMVKALNDPYTHFLDPKEAKASQESRSGHFVGVGMKLDGKDGTLKVTGTMSGSPAEKAGIKAGDVVVAVNDMPVKGEDAEATITRIRGEEGTKVKVTIFRQGAPNNPVIFNLVRASIDTPTVKWKMLNSGGKVIAHITVEQFGDDTRQLFAKAIEATLAAKATGIILDLRDDGGGRLDVAGFITCAWVPKGPFTILGGRKDTKEDEPLMCRGYAPLADLPVAVLVNGHSASASEITAGALQDYGKGRVFGETTYGKGCGQSVVRFPDGAELIIVSFLWFTPNGRSIHKKGITPDEIIKADPADLAKGKDVQLERALQYLVTGH